MMFLQNIYAKHWKRYPYYFNNYFSDKGRATYMYSALNVNIDMLSLIEFG